MEKVKDPEPTWTVPYVSTVLLTILSPVGPMGTLKLKVPLYVLTPEDPAEELVAEVVPVGRAELVEEAPAGPLVDLWLVDVWVAPGAPGLPTAV